MPEKNFLGAGHALDVETQMNSSATGAHLLLGEFVVPILMEDPTAETRGKTDGATVGWIDADNNIQLSMYSREQDAWTTVGETTLEAVNALAARLEAQPEDTDLKDVLVQAGMVVDEGETPLDLDGGALTAGDITGTFDHQGALFAIRGRTPVADTFHVLTGSLSTDLDLIVAAIAAHGDELGFWTDSTTP
jgi:hypothetical protein